MIAADVFDRCIEIDVLLVHYSLLVWHCILEIDQSVDGVVRVAFVLLEERPEVTLEFRIVYLSDGR